MDVRRIAGPLPPSQKYRFTTDEERKRRLDLLRQAMHQAQLSALIVCGRDDVRYRGRTFYVSDIWQFLADTHIVILSEGSPIFIGGQVFGLEQASQSDWVEEFHMSGYPGIEIANVLRSNGLADSRVGVVGMSDSSFAVQHFNELRDSLPQVQLHDATVLFESVRQINSEESLEALRLSSDVFRRVFTALEPRIRPRMTEIQLAAEAHYVCRELGLRNPMILVQTTPYGRLAFGTTKQIERNDIVTVQIESVGPTGYWVEYRRCYSFGAPSKSHSDYWDLHRAAVEAGLAASRPGRTAHSFAAAVQEALEVEGYTLGIRDPGDPHSLFSLHGIGTDAIQGVWIPGNDRELKDRETATIHPIVQFANEADSDNFRWFGIADTMLVTEEGGILLTHEPGVPDGLVEL